MHLAFRLGSEHFSIDAERSADAGFTVSVRGGPHRRRSRRACYAAHGDRGRAHMVRTRRGTVHVALDGVSYVLEPDTPVPASMSSRSADRRATPERC
jgi:hypothetical protein